jgi:hypothetical protein
MSHALPCYALPCYALPSRALLLIREYSKPLTRPNWRESKPIITTYLLFSRTYYIRHYIPEQILPPSKYVLDYRLLCNILQTNWYYKYQRQHQRMIY